MSIFYIAFGGNLGDVPAAFHAARQCIEQLEFTNVTASSLLYRTPPLGPPGQAYYYNAVIAAQSELAAEDFLDALQMIEAEHGRIRAEHWGPRTLDLDIIAIDAETMDTKRLTVPHAHMQNRQFVLRPLCDIAPSWQHPRLGETASQLLDSLLQAGEPALPKGSTW